MSHQHKNSKRLMMLRRAGVSITGDCDITVEFFMRHLLEVGDVAKSRNNQLLLVRVDLSKFWKLPLIQGMVDLCRNPEITKTPAAKRRFGNLNLPDRIL